MNRLLQGEVGSGKTLVALRAMLRVVDSGGQAALLAPTEVLAQQHHRSITAMLGDLAAGGMMGGTNVELLTGSMTKAQRTEPLSRLAIGESGIVIGTHALLEDQVQFFDLGLVVVDEQHRFGVEQRAALTDKALGVAAARAGDDRDADPAHRRDDGLRRPRGLDARRAAGRPRRDPDHRGQPARPSAGLDGPGLGPGARGGREGPPGLRRLPAHQRRRARGGRARLRRTTTRASPRTARPSRRSSRSSPSSTTHHLADLRVAALHGRMPSDEKDRTMRAFAAGEIDVLISTTVIEVGVDVANATTMVILDADRFGISQLHQLRGRVGRGGLPGLCLLVTYAGAMQDDARGRLDALARSSDGFELSRDRPRAAPRGRRARPFTVRLPLHAGEPPGAPRRGDDRRRPRRRRGAARRRRRRSSGHPDLRAAVRDWRHRREGAFMEKS